MHVILFNSEEHPKVGETYTVKEIYPFSDGCYGPRTAVVLEKVSPVSLDKKIIRGIL